MLRQIDLISKCQKPLGVLFDDAGNVAIVAAILFPALGLLAAGALDLTSVSGDKSRMQEIADAAAIEGAQQMRVVPEGAAERAVSFADAKLSDMRTRATVNATAIVVDATTMKVTLTGHRDSFFGNMLPPGGWNLRAEATAIGQSATPLCVLITGGASPEDLALGAGAKVSAPACLVSANHKIIAQTGAALQAGKVQAVVSATGPITPAAQVGGKAIPDPFVRLDTSFPSACSSTAAATSINSSTTLASGVHCGDISVGGNSTVTLGIGEHYFAKTLKVSGGSQLKGNDVVMVFGPQGGTDLKNATNIDVNGRKTGQFAGFVLVVDRARSAPFALDTDRMSNVTGTVYSPTATLVVNGTVKAATQSAWTVVAARSLSLQGTPEIVINSNYLGSSVPVPWGVGNKSSPARLTE